MKMGMGVRVKDVCVLGENMLWAYLMPAGIAVSSSKGRAASALVCDEPKFLIIAA